MDLRAIDAKTNRYGLNDVLKYYSTTESTFSGDDDDPGELSR